jgi:ribosomal protein S18 acetylase RimI-like enzyme
MTLDIKIRLTEWGDLPFLQKWLSHPYAKLSYMPETEEEATVCTKMWMSYAPLKCSLTATVQGEPVGIVTLQLNPFTKIKHTAEFSIIVSPEYQKGGVGTLLMNEFIKMCKERFLIESIYLHVFQGSGAIKFYKKLGFKKFGEQKKWIKDPDTKAYRDRIFMEKVL